MCELRIWYHRARGRHFTWCWTHEKARWGKHYDDCEATTTQQKKEE